MFNSIVQSKYFQNFIMVIILIASILVGIETYPEISGEYFQVLRVLDTLIQTIFTVEITMRIFAYGSKPHLFFKSGWNLFDFIVTVVFYLPFGGAYASVLRLVRIFRVLRLVTALPKLQILVGALIKSVPSIGYVALLMFVQFYIFAIVGNSQFGANDPANFGSLGQSFMTLFQVVTLEGWVEIYKSQPNVTAATIYFISFILLGTMIVLNLFIGVIIDGFDEIKKEVDEDHLKHDGGLKNELKNAAKQIEALKNHIDQLAKKMD